MTDPATPAEGGANSAAPEASEPSVEPGSLLGQVLGEPLLRARLAHTRALDPGFEAPTPDALQRFADGVVGRTDDELAAVAPGAEDEREVVRLERHRRRLSVGGDERWCAREPGVVGAVGGGVGALFLHLRFVVLHGALTLLCAAAVYGLLARLPTSTWGRLAGAVGLVVLLSWLLRLVGGAALGALAAARGRRPIYGLCPADMAQPIWALWVVVGLAPRELGRALAPVAGPVAGGAPRALGLAAFAVLLLVAMDRGLGPIAACAALLRDGRRLARLIAVSGVSLVAVVGLGLLRARGARAELFVSIMGLAASAAALVVGVTAARVVAAWSDVEARAVARARGRRTLVEGAEESWREWVAALLLSCTAMPTLSEAWATQQLGDLGALAPWVVSSGGSLRPTFVLVPLVLALTLLWLEHRRRRRIDADDDGLLLDVTPRWPGARIPWSRVSLRADAQGVTLGLSGQPTAFGPRVPWSDDDPEGLALVAWLQDRGARLDG